MLLVALLLVRKHYQSYNLPLVFHLLDIQELRILMGELSHDSRYNM